MALADLKSFVIQCLSNVDSTLDLSPGSPYDTQVIEPILTRLGTDPFTVDIGLFIQTTLNQQFPDMPTKEGDAITDLLIKAVIVLWNPLVREITRVANNLSFEDPSILTTDEAQALGANLFAPIQTGQYATGVVRIYFAQPQSAGVTPANFVTSSEGLRFNPTQSQSIRVDEMLLNLEGTLYYFDVNLVAAAPGDQYNIPADDLVTIANVASATRLTNKVRFQNGLPAETAVAYVSRIEQALTERSLVTARGIIFQVETTLSEVVSCFPIGFNDPEMHRDVITGGGLGAILASGSMMTTESDGQNALLTRRVVSADSGVDFTALIGPTGAAPPGFVLTLFNAFPAAQLPVVRDLQVLTVVDAHTLDCVEQTLSYTAPANLMWTLRENSLTLSGIPGGILFPNTPYGTIDMPNGEVHIGGCTDVYVSGSAFDTEVLTLDDIVDDQPVLEGTKLNANIASEYANTSFVQLQDYVLAPGAGANYSVNDAVWTALAAAESNGLSVQILDPPNAGTYRILSVTQGTPGTSPILLITPSIQEVSALSRWLLSDRIFIDLLNPKQTKVSGSDMSTTLGQSIVTTESGVDFANYGVSEGDILQILSGGIIESPYTVKAVQDPFFNELLLDRPLAASVNDVQYVVYTPNAGGGMVMPFVRVTEVSLLDTSGQPVGTTIPYAKPVDCQTNGFASIGAGIKGDVADAILGIVSVAFPEVGGVPALALDGLTLTLYDTANDSGNLLVTVNFVAGSLAGGLLSPQDVAMQIGAAVATVTTPPITRAAVPLGADINNNPNRVGLLPFIPALAVYGGTASVPLFGYATGPGTVGIITTRDITSAGMYAQGGWASLRPALDASYDVAQVLDGTQLGFYQLSASIFLREFDPVPNIPFNNTHYDPLRTLQDFNPEIGRHLQVGSRSLGTVVLYFIDPTSFEINEETVFTYTGNNGSVLHYFPDPTQRYQVVPPLPSGTKPLDGTSTNTAPYTFWSSASSNFVTEGIQFGDELVIDFAPVAGTVSLADPVVNLNTKTLVISLAGGPDKTITFINDSAAIAATDVTRTGVVTQINNTVGTNICSLNASNQLVFNPTTSIIIRGAFGSTGAGSGPANLILGFSNTIGVDQNNDAPDAGTYTIEGVAVLGDVTTLQISPVTPFPAPGSVGEQFSIVRPGIQRIVSTNMATNTEDGGLYGFQVQLVSEGTGTQYNLGANLQLEVDGYLSDGYYLTTDDPNLSFSPVERPKLILSTSILAPGVSDSPANATFLGGQNIQVTYERSATVQDTNNFITADTERVICASPLARHLTPYFVRFTLTYFGGSTADLVTSDCDTFIEAIAPNGSLNVSDLEAICANRNATSVMNPIDLIAIIHNIDRSLSAERSQNKLNTGRLAAFFSDVLQISRNISGS